MTDSYTFRVVFAGLCGYVPNKSLDDENDPPTRMRVLLPEGIRSAEKLHLQHHLSALVIPSDNLKNDNGSVPDLEFKRRNGREFDFYDLSGLDVSLEIDDAEPSDLQVAFGELSKPIPDDFIPPTGPEAKLFAWVPRLDVAAGADGAGAVISTCWGKSPNTDRVDARIELSSGRLQTQRLSIIPGEMVEKTAIWELRKVTDPVGAGLVRQATADTVSWEHDVPVDNVVTLVGKRFNGSEIYRLELGPADVNETQFDIDISSLEWPEILNVSNQYDPPKVLQDLTILYRLTEAVDPDPFEPEPPLPIPHFFLPEGLGRPVHCPEGVFAPDSNA